MKSRLDLPSVHLDIIIFVPSLAASDAPQSDYSHPDVLTSSFSNTSTQLLNDTKCLVPENLISLNFPARDPAAVASRVVELVTASATKTGRIMNTFCGG